MKVHEAKKGFEVEFDLLVKKKEDLSAEKEKAYAEAKAKIDADYAERETTIFQLLSLITDEVEADDIIGAEGEVDKAPVAEEVVDEQSAQAESQATQAPGQAFSPFTRIV